MAVVSYGVKLNNLTQCLNPTIKVFRDAVRYLINISLLHYEDIKDLSPNIAMNFIEALVHSTSNRMAKYPAFDKVFYKMPSYIRRNAITVANAKVDGYKKLVALWEANGCAGKKPHINYNQDVMPCFYRKNMFIETSNGFAIKVYHHNDWVWLPATLRKTDLDYIHKNCRNLKESAPVLNKVNRGYELRFMYTLPKSTKTFTKDKDIKTAVGVDLGLNTDAVCSVVTTEGTVMGQKFINNPVEKDRLYTTLNRIKKCQANGNSHPYRLWRFADYYNKAISIKTAVAIVDYAKSVNADVIVFENLSNLRGKAHGKSKQKIGLWRKQDIQHRVEEMATRIGIRVSFVCAYNTSRLAFDGSSEVTRGTKATYHTNSLCRFANGKQYNCDLSASKNIAARFIIRCKQKSMSATAWLQAQAKVPELCTRTKCTLATLINLSAVAA